MKLLILFLLPFTLQSQEKVIVVKSYLSSYDTSFFYKDGCTLKLKNNMSIRTDRRKQIKKQDLRIKSVKQWESEFLQLPRIIQAFVIAFHNGKKVPENVIEEAKVAFPQYWVDGVFEPIKLK